MIWKWHKPQALDGGRIFVSGIRNERVERVSQPSLPYELERSAAHPSKDVEFGRASLVNLDVCLDTLDEL